MLWLQYEHLLEHEILKKVYPIGYTTVCCCPHVECEHQFALRTAIDCSCRHAREAKRSGKPWMIRMVSSRGPLYTVTEAWWTAPKLPFIPTRCYFSIVDLASFKSGHVLGHCSIYMPKTKQVRTLRAQILRWGMRDMHNSWWRLPGNIWRKPIELML